LMIGSPIEVISEKLNRLHTDSVIFICPPSYEYVISCNTSVDMISRTYLGTSIVRRILMVHVVN
jgi:hypothetical protein